MTSIDLSQLDWIIVASVFATFFGAGVVKGVVGVGLPMISVPIIASITGNPALAIAMASVPILISNGWQAVQGGHLGDCVRRFWPILLSLAGGTALGVQVLVSIDPSMVARILGIILVVFILIQFFPVKLSVPTQMEHVIGVPIGILAGILGGLSSLFAPLLVVLMVAFRLPKDWFVSAAGLLFFTGTVPLFFGLIAHEILQGDELIASAVSCLPVMLGFTLGRRMRNLISQSAFEKVLYVILVLIGLNLIRRSFI
ncbi:MAG: sulfite exporter TauE/SafE family protein [Alphaproteobacteria bacterium]|nr:sulfite exporter TauE/SafE family protein [Alphaproteobacteria bacterium]